MCSCMAGVSNQSPDVVEAKVKLPTAPREYMVIVLIAIEPVLEERAVTIKLGYPAQILGTSSCAGCRSGPSS